LSALTLEAAQAALQAALAKAREIGSPSSVAVLDSGRELLAFARMDDALLASAEISQAKAYTARSLNCATKDVDVATQPGGPLFGLQTSHLAAGRSLVTFGGGVPITTVGGAIVGAIGVAGGSPDQDHEVAAAGAAAAGK
jgi:uncharacterized protein GlcG (DUF336 family)